MSISPVSWLNDKQYLGLPDGHRAVAWADSQVGVREIGKNRGKQVLEYQAVAGLGNRGGFAWCACFVYWCCLKAGIDACCLPRIGKCAAVRNWVSLARKQGKVQVNPARGRLFFWLDSRGYGHIGFCLGGSVLGVFRTIEGNTDGENGSRDGDGVYKRTRTTWGLRKYREYGFIDLS